MKGPSRISAQRRTARASRPLVVNFGGGVNSTALLVGLHERGMRPDLILFADTGDEKPDTYRHIWEIQPWLESVGFPSLIILRRQITRGKNKGRVFTLEQECRANRTLPSRVFGPKGGCSGKWKRQVVDGFLKKHYRAQLTAGRKVRRALGIDFGELDRARFSPSDLFEWEYPLIDWRWNRDDCVRAVERAGLRVPGKSACFYCPASKKADVVKLMEEHPDLFARAVKMERYAKPNLRKKIGLGGMWTWEALGKAHRRKLPMVAEDPHVACDPRDGCFS